MTPTEAEWIGNAIKQLIAICQQEQTPTAITRQLINTINYLRRKSDVQIALIYMLMRGEKAWMEQHALWSQEEALRVSRLTREIASPVTPRSAPSHRNT